MNAPRAWIRIPSAPCTEGLDELRTQIGGKALSLHVIARAGLRVPVSFVITAEACREYFRRDRRWPDDLWEQVQQGVLRLQQETGLEFGDANAPLLLAVRSGAAVSMPGLMDTFLNCGLVPAMLPDDPEDSLHSMFAEFVSSFGGFRGDAESSFNDQDSTTIHELLDRFEQAAKTPFPTDPWELLRETISRVFDSWNSPRAQVYRDRHDIGDDRGTAVIVQSMFPAALSGVLFTRDPLDGDADRMRVEAVSGLGTSLVSGSSVAYQWLLPRGRAEEADFRACIEDDAQAPNDPLPPEHLQTLHAAGLQLEDVFESPLDIEWGCQDGALVFFQARPIQTAAVPTDAEPVCDREREHLGTLAHTGRPLWVRHNLSESLSRPTPLTWSLWKSFMSGSGGLGNLYRKLGYAPARDVRTDGFLELIGGEIYASADRISGLYCRDYPFSFDGQRLKEDPSTLDRGPTQFDPDRTGPWFLLQLPRMLFILWRASRRIRRLARTAADRFDRDVLPSFQRYVQRERDQQLSQLDIPQLLARFEGRRRTVLDEFGPESLLPGTIGAIAYAELERRLIAILGRPEGASLAARLVRGLEIPVVGRQRDLLGRIGAGEAVLPRFLEEFGHRTLSEMELSVPRWCEDPRAVESLAASLAHANAAAANATHDDRPEDERLSEELRGALRAAGAGSLAAEIERPLLLARRLLPYRESGKHELMRGVALLRDVTEELSRRCSLGNDVYFLTIDELASLLDGANHDETIARRRTERDSAARRCLPPVIDLRSDHPFARGNEPTSADSKVISATPLSPGKAHGPARNRGASDAGPTIDPGDILVTSALYPEIFPLLHAASAIVVDRGGVLSHGAILAREFGVPAVVCPNATVSIRTSDRIHVDADAGTVIIERDTP